MPKTLKEVQDFARGELREIVATYEWLPVDSEGVSFDITVKIKILKFPNDKFLGFPNRCHIMEGQSMPYVSLDRQNTVEDALEDCIRGLNFFMGSREEVRWLDMENY